MSTHAHARRGNRFDGIKALFWHRENHPARVVNVGMPGFQTPMNYRPDPEPGEAMWEPAAPASEQDETTLTMPVSRLAPVHMVSGADGIQPCCGLSETQVPRTDFVTANPWLVTCRTSAHDTMPDDRARMDRPFAPANEACRHSPDIAADLAALPLFREAVAARTRSSAAECLCGHATGGQGWGERMVRAGMHLTGMDASRILDAAPHLTIPAAVALSEPEVAA